VGCVRASVPLTAVGTQGTSIEVEELMLTVRPQQERAQQQRGGEAPPSPPQDAGGVLSLEDIGLGQATVMEGIKRIAGGIEKLLQLLTVVARGTTVRVELPPTAACPRETVALLRAGAVSYHDATPEAQAPGAPPAAAGAPAEVIKVFDVQGLALELYEAPDDEAGAAAAAPGSPAGGQQQQQQRQLQQSRLVAMSAAAAEESDSSEPCLGGWELEVARQACGPGEAAPAAGGRAPGAGAWDRNWCTLGCASTCLPLARPARSPAHPCPAHLPPAPCPFPAASTDAAGSGSDPAPSVCSADLDPTAAVLTGPDRQGVCMQLRLRMSWGGAAPQQPQLSADVALGPLCLALCPHHLPMLLGAQEWAQRLAQRAADAAAAEQAVQAAAPGPCVAADGWGDLAGGEEGHWGRCAGQRGGLRAWRRLQLPGPPPAGLAAAPRAGALPGHRPRAQRGAALGGIAPVCPCRAPAWLPPHTPALPCCGHQAAGRYRAPRLLSPQPPHTHKPTTPPAGAPWCRTSSSRTASTWWPTPWASRSC
jgi:hypothetical protein